MVVVAILSLLGRWMSPSEVVVVMALLVVRGAVVAVAILPSLFQGSRRIRGHIWVAASIGSDCCVLSRER